MRGPFVLQDCDHLRSLKIKATDSQQRLAWPWKQNLTPARGGCRRALSRSAGWWNRTTLRRTRTPKPKLARAFCCGTPRAIANGEHPCAIESVRGLTHVCFLALHQVLFPLPPLQVHEAGGRKHH